VNTTRNTTSINDEFAKKIVESKSNDIKLTQRPVKLSRHGNLKSFTSQERAREIMQHNCFGVEEAIKHFGVNPSKREFAALANVPFTEETLNACKHTHVLVAVFPLSILDIRSRVDRDLFSCNCLGNSHPDSTHENFWYNKQAFAEDRGQIGWHLVRKTPVPGSDMKTWNEQQKFLGKDEEMPSARVMVYTMVGRYLSTRQRLFAKIPENRRWGKPWERPYIRCSDSLSSDNHVVVGCFDYNDGVSIERWYLDDKWYDDVGIAPARKSEF
jgi:hypothetical protein